MPNILNNLRKIKDPISMLLLEKKKIKVIFFFVILLMIMYIIGTLLSSILVGGIIALVLYVLFNFNEKMTFIVGSLIVIFTYLIFYKPVYEESFLNYNELSFEGIEIGPFIKDLNADTYKKYLNFIEEKNNNIVPNPSQGINKLQIIPYEQLKNYVNNEELQNYIENDGNWGYTERFIDDVIMISVNRIIHIFKTLTIDNRIKNVVNSNEIEKCNLLKEGLIKENLVTRSLIDSLGATSCDQLKQLKVEHINFMYFKSEGEQIDYISNNPYAKNFASFELYNMFEKSTINILSTMPPRLAVNSFQSYNILDNNHHLLMRSLYQGKGKIVGENTYLKCEGVPSGDIYRDVDSIPDKIAVVGFIPNNLYGSDLIKLNGGLEETIILNGKSVKAHTFPKNSQTDVFTQKLLKPKIVKNSYDNGVLKNTTEVSNTEAKMILGSNNTDIKYIYDDCNLCELNSCQFKVNNKLPEVMQKYWGIPDVTSTTKSTISTSKNVTNKELTINLN